MYKVASVLVFLSYACPALRKSASSRVARQRTEDKSRAWSEAVSMPASIAEMHELNERAGHNQTVSSSPYRMVSRLLLALQPVLAFNAPLHRPIAHGTKAVLVSSLPTVPRVAVDMKTSYESVRNWPPLKIYTFAEPGIRDSEVSAKFPGARIVVEGDPVTDIGKSFGFEHGSMLPVISIDPQEVTSSLEFIGQNASDDKDDSWLTSRLEPVALLARRVAVALRLHRFDLSGGRLDPTKLARSLADAFRSTGLDPAWLDLRGGRLDPTKLARSLADAFRFHLIGTYLEILRRRLVQGTQGSTAENLQNYRMAMLSYWTSYADANLTNIASSVQVLLTAENPLEPESPLFEETLEHLMTIQFFTPANSFSRSWSDLGYDKAIFGFDGPIWEDFETWKVGEQGIAHHVHLLVDSANDGYLTFQGSANLGIFLDVHVDFAKYNPDTKDPEFVERVDDESWGDVDLRDLRGCHTGLCKTLKAFILSESFPVLAKRISRLDSLTIVGHSAGGALGTMFAKMVYEIQRKSLEELGSARLD